MKYIDLRSDTVTWPTPEMREAMYKAVVGDDDYGDDPSVNELEEYAAHLVGKEAALFVPSGIFGNQLALLTHCKRGSEVIIDEQTHIVQYECGGAAFLAGVQLRTLDTQGSIPSAAQIEQRVRTGNDIHEPSTGLICLENAHTNGRVFSVQAMEKVRRCANRYSIPIHLDGARIFNAAAALDVEAKEIAAHADSVMFCLSKGLCAPAGSILAGTRTFITAARRNRKCMGGGMRQAGILAAAGLIALKTMRGRLADDHRTADALAQALSKIDEIEVDFTRKDINFIFFKQKAETNCDPEAFVEFMREKNILINPCSKDGCFRFVTHYWITDAHIPIIAAAVKEFYR